ncbi:MAG: phosphatase PAP2 family protein [Eubacteriales bacterium]|nr:phosphatase PAP2 family protein [Eubacteriales bacterium]
MSVLYALEGIRTPFGDLFFSAVTHLGEETVFMVAAIFVFWCVSKKEGYYLLTVGFLGTIFNQFLKLLFRIPRPWVKDPDFTIVESARAEATGYSFPSGHTQSAVGTFGGIARFVKRSWVRLVCVVLLLLVAFSRMYLGVHTPLDVGVSFVLGTLLVLAVYPLMDWAYRKPGRMAGLFGVMALLCAAELIFVYGYPFPADIDAANLASGRENAWKLLGSVVGVALSWGIDVKWLRFETRARWWAQIAKLAIGLALVIAVRTLLKAPLLALFGDAGIAGCVRYFLVVLTACVLWPATFGWWSRLGERQRK